MKTNTGGSAFPCGYHPEGNSADQSGMTLRDYFAAKALLALITEPQFGENSRPIIARIGNEGLYECDNYAFAAYKLADAMIAERGAE